MNSAWVYILTNHRHTVLYVGITNSIATRHWEHVTRCNPKSFTARYNVSKIVYYSGFKTVVDAIQQEKYIKGKSRKWKERLVSSQNPQWLDLANELKNL